MEDVSRLQIILQDMKIPKLNIPSRKVEGMMCENLGVGLGQEVLETVPTRMSKRKMWVALDKTVSISQEVEPRLTKNVFISRYLDWKSSSPIQWRRRRRY